MQMKALSPVETEAGSGGDGGGLRHELKLVSQEMAYPRVYRLLMNDSIGLRTLHPERRVQSVYLDTPECRAFQDNLSGISHREKVRFRWYGSEVDRVAGRLECKIRENKYGWKQVKKLTIEREIRGVDRVSFVRKLGEDAGLDWQIRLQGLQPAQWIAYDRQYLGSADGKLRITLDRGLRVWDQRMRFALDNRFPTPVPRMLIMEVKCAAIHYEAAQRLVNRLPMMVGKCSKYVLASEPAEGPEVQLLYT
ncbi:Polyphosphate polymerase domain-containing protein [Sulfidibacter corallicola]|nr:polyphosphate polymerase domain-containing protein [Sulfidibacter corallicola]